LLLGVGEDGQSTLEVREILLATSIWLDWLEIAYEHLDEARAARRDMTAAIRASDEDEENRAADREFKAALQVVTAAAGDSPAACDNYWDGGPVLGGVAGWVGCASRCYRCCPPTPPRLPRPGGRCERRGGVRVRAGHVRVRDQGEVGRRLAAV
jgi:hypothetical protein